MKIRNTRWKCNHCGGEGWSTPLLDGRTDHDRPDGRKCRKAGNITVIPVEKPVPQTVAC